MSAVPGAADKAKRVVEVIQDWFEQTYSFDMEEIAKRGLKEGVKKIARSVGVTDFAVAWVTQHGLGGHAMPLDQPAIRLLTRVAALDDPAADVEAMRGTVEHFVTKAKGPLFVELVSAAAHELCTEVEPDCPHCPLKDECPYGQERLKLLAAGGGKPRKPR